MAPVTDPHPCCPSCGQFLPPARPLGLRLSRGDEELLGHVRRAGVHGIPTQALFDRLYADDPDGGPLTGVKVLHVRVNTLNRRLRSVGKVIWARDRRYVLMDCWPRRPGRGERKLTPRQVDAVQAAYATGRWTQAELALRWGVGQQHVSVILRNEDLAAYYAQKAKRYLAERAAGRALLRAAGGG